MQIKNKITDLSMLSHSRKRKCGGTCDIPSTIPLYFEGLHLGDRELQIFQHVCDFILFLLLDI